MPLNLSVNDGEFTPFLKYNAKAGRFYIRPQGATADVEVKNPLLAFDMANIKTGWIYYAEGLGPERVWDPSPTQMAARPPGPKKFKRGFEVLVFGNAKVQGAPLGLREFSSSAGTVISVMVAMYAEYEAGAPKNPGKVPLFACTDVNPVQSAYGTNYEPMFKLHGWVERSKIPAFDEALEAAPTTPAATNGEGFDETNPPARNDLDDEIPW